jgi:2-hydroxychromene-2-carboxylate isomerase
VNIAAIQKKIDSASIVITIAPMLKIGVAFKAMTVHRPAVPPNSRRAKWNKRRLVAAASTGLKKRTPNSFAPKTAVLARMAKAIPGPLLN